MDNARFLPTQVTSPKFYVSSEAEFENNENKNTKRKTETDMRIFLSYLVSINETREPEKIAPEELDKHLATYFSVIKKHDGNEYEPASLRGMLCSIERYLRSKNYTVSLTRDAEFTNTRNMLKERQKVLREMVKLDKYTKPDTLASNTVNRLNQLYLAKEFGPHNPSSVINALCFVFVVNLKIRKAIDHKQLLWGDISLRVSSDGEEYLCYEPMPGFDNCRLPLKGISGHKVLAQNSDTSLWDPITIYKLYRHKRPSNMMTPESPFYLGIAVTPHESLQHPWFKSVAMGVNKLNDLVRMIRDLTGSLGQSPSPIIDLYNSNSRDPRDDTCNVENDYSSHDIRKYPDTLNDRNGDAYDDDNDSPVDMSPTATASVEIRNEPKTPEEVRDTEDKTTVETETAKENIQNILNSLSKEAKSEVLQWLFPKSIYKEETNRQAPCRKPATRKRLRVTLDINDEDIDQHTSFDKIAKIQVLPKLQIPTIDKKDETIAVTEPNHTRLDDEEKSSDAESDTNTHGEHNGNDIPKQDNPIDFKLKSPTIDSASEAPNFDVHHSTSAPDHINKSPINTAPDMDMKQPMPGYNPYAAWAIDPRFAMFMRNGFLQTYQDFVNIYSNSDIKDNPNK